MAQSLSDKFRHEIERISKYHETGALPEETTAALLEWATALDPSNSSHEYVDANGDAREFAVGTAQSYLREMRKFAERARPRLLEVSPTQFNAEIDAMWRGDNDHVKQGGLSKTTLAVTQSAARSFFWYFDIADPEEIEVYGPSTEPKHDQADLLTSEDVRALRSEIQNERNRAILEMLLHTGQRISVIQGLRIRDVDTESGYFHLNTERGDLKCAEQRGTRRPLLGARQHVENWLAEHPFSASEESYLFIGDPDHHKTKVDQPLCQGTIRRMLKRAAEETGVDRPVNPHNFRHYWTTVMKQEYGLNDEEIKLLLGHAREGNGLNTTYNHSVERKLRQNTDWKLGNGTDAPSKSLTPGSCDSCGESLESYWTCCPVCGTSYGP